MTRYAVAVRDHTTGEHLGWLGPRGYVRREIVADATNADTWDDQVTPGIIAVRDTGPSSEHTTEVVELTAEVDS